MNALKKRNMMAAYNGFAGSRTLEAVMAQVPDELWDRLTGRELGIVMTAINASFHKGKASAGAEVVDDCIWVAGKLIPLAAIEAITVKETVEYRPRKPHHIDPNPPEGSTERWTTRKYTLDYVEKV